MQDIRLIVQEEAKSVVDHALKPIENRLITIEDKLEALENDVKEIYSMIAEIQKDSNKEKDFSKLSAEDKVRKIYRDVKLMARELNVELS